MNIRLATIGDFVDPVTNWNPATKPHEQFTYIDLSSVSQAEKRIVAANPVTGVDAPSRARQIVKAGDILVSTVRPNLNGVAPVTEEFDGATASTGFCILRPRPQKLCSNYLMHWVRSPDFIKSMVGQATGASYPAVTDRIVKSSLIPLPPLDEQRRIAVILDKADALRRKRKRAMELLSDVTKSTFLEMFGDPVTNPKGFPKVSFGEIGKLDRGISKHRPRNDPALLGGPYPLIQTGDVASSGGYIQRYSSTYSEAGLKQSKLWPAGTLCITIAANIAETGILMFPACFPDSVVGFTHKEPGMTQFVRVWLSFLKSTLERTAPTVAQKNINLQILRAVQVALPPSQMIAAFGEKLEVQKALMDALGNATSKEENLFSSLQHRAFSGQL
ncbi:restriction endonuclease subunit S [Rhodopseudomonas pseudopalustris]|uniref:restriction endonuclease subunit S n=1 Tax=Rhodopseudomonas pseudopalustris TaxID=1513892 RepID=UPI003F9762CA